MEILEAAGKTIREKYCNKNKYIKEREAIMFPPAPNLSSFIDAFHREKLSNKEKTEKQRQDEYEAEVEVFRALEREENIIVLHGLKYTHQQYSFCVPSHESSDCKKKDLEEEGECDFIVIGDNFLAVLEVKSPDMNSKNPENMFSDRYSESKKQRVITIDMINGIFQQTCSSENPVIFEFSVFNRMSKEDVEMFAKYKSLSADSLEKIALKDDMVDFKQWWKEKVISKITKDMQPLDNRPVNALLGLWCADNKNSCDVEKCSLANCILEIDDKLKSEIITRVPKGPINKDVKGASPVFKKYLGIECLTSQQAEIFKSKNNFHWITGPAGSGKSVLMLGKIIQIFENKRAEGKSKSVPSNIRNISCASKKNKCILIVFGRKRLGEKTSDFYEPALENANIRYVSVDLTEEGFIMPSEDNYDVVIVYCFVEFYRSCESLLTMDNHHLFIDDAEHLFLCNFVINQKEKTVNLLNLIRKRSKNNNNYYFTWVACDMAQLFYLSHKGNSKSLPLRQWRVELIRYVRDCLKDFDTVSLSANLRNTAEIAKLLQVLRNEIQQTLSEDLLGFLPMQNNGHFIHGIIPKIVVYIKSRDNSNDSMFMKAKQTILDETESLKELPREMLGQINCYGLSHEMRFKGRDNSVQNVASVEWPAVISSVYNLYKCEDDFDRILSQLYINISRALVYSSTVISLRSNRQNDHKFQNLIEKLKPYAKIGMIHM